MTAAEWKKLMVSGPSSDPKAAKRYVVESAIVLCSKGTAPTSMVASINSRIGSKHAIVDIDTPSSAFSGDFGICETLSKKNGKPTQCAMKNLPKWFNTNTKYILEGNPTVTMASFAACAAGGGAIIPLTDGQSKASFGLLALLMKMLLGMFSAAACEKDPINTATGNFFYAKDDIEVPGQFPIVFKRFYNVMGDSSDGVLGKDWTHNYNIFITADDKSRAASITFDDGHVEEYNRRDDGSYVSSPECQSTLVQYEDRYILTLPSKETYHFDIRGRLFKMRDLNGNDIKLNYYKEDGRLGKVSNVCGSLTFSYNKQGQIIKLTDHTGRVAQYEYDKSLLVRVTQASGAVYSYEYGEGDKISKVINPLGVAAIENEYDAENRAVKQRFADGGVAAFRYHSYHPYTILTEQNGNEITYVRDDQFRTTAIAYKDGSREKFAYNKQNKRTKYVDRNGSASTYVYDKSGNLTQTTDPMGRTTSLVYNELNKPVKITKPSGGVATFEYDPKGNMLKAIDPLEREMYFSHNSQGLLTLARLPDLSENSITYDERGNTVFLASANGNATKFEYDNLNRVIKVTDGEGKSTLFEYAGNGNIAKVTNAVGKFRRYEYNLSGKVIKITDFDGGVIQYKYNNVGKVEEVVDQARGSTKFTYDLMWKITSVTNPCGHTVKYVYDQYQRIIQTIDEEGNATSYEHDCKGNVTAAISPNGARTEIEYDALDRQTKITEPDGAVTEFAYDKGGNLAAITDALGNTTTREYDLAGQLIKLTDPLGNATKFTYAPLGQIECITDPVGERTSYSYFPGGRLKSVTLPSGESESYEYDRNGNIITVTDALGAKTELKYDALDRVVEVVNPLGESKKYGYDALGNITSVTDEKGNITQYKYSLLGEIIEVIDASGHSTKYGYDAMRRLAKLEQFRTIEKPDTKHTGIKLTEYQITTYKRNKKGEVIAVKSPLGKEVKFQYNKVGGVTSKVDEDGFETLYEYNLANTLTKVSYADGKTVEFGYNALKQLTVMEDWLGVTRIELDPLGRATKVTDAQGNEVGYRWNPLGQKEALIYPDGSEVNYEYNASGRISRVVSGVETTDYRYDRMGRMSECILPDGITTKYEVNPLGRLAGLTHMKDGDILDQFKYTYDLAGNIKQMEKFRAGLESDSGLFEYTYDPLNRLTSVVRNDGERQRYRYDELGNRTKYWQGQRGEASNWTVHEYNQRNQLIKTTEPDGGDITNYRYDKRGNLTQITVNDGLKSRFDFDATNMMVGAYTAGKGTAQYTYDGLRNRVQKIEDLSEMGRVADPVTGVVPDPVSEVRYVLDRTLPYNNLLATSGAQKQSFVWGNGLISAKGEDKFFYLQDHLGSPVRLLGDDGFEEVLAFDAFGKSTSKSSQPFGFTGYMTDDVSGMYYAQNRFYVPSLGRFSAIDPIKDGLNFYEYARSNPIRFIDPSGLFGQLFPPNGTSPQSDVNRWFAEQFFQEANDRWNNSLAGNQDATDFEREFGQRVEGANGFSSRGFYGGYAGPRIRDGIEIVRGEVGMGRVGQEHERGEWSFGGPSVEARAGMTRHYIGGTVGGSLVSGSAEGQVRVDEILDNTWRIISQNPDAYVVLPRIFREFDFIIGIEGELVAAGLRGEVTNNRLRIGASAFVGGNLIFGFERRECPS